MLSVRGWPAEFIDGSFGWKKMRQSSSIAPKAKSAMAVISFRREPRFDGSTFVRVSVWIVAIAYSSELSLTGRCCRTRFYAARRASR